MKAMALAIGGIPEACVENVCKYRNTFTATFQHRPRISRDTVLPVTHACIYCTHSCIFAREESNSFEVYQSPSGRRVKISQTKTICQIRSRVLTHLIVSLSMLFD